MLPIEQRIRTSTEFSRVIKEGNFFRWEFGYMWILASSYSIWGDYSTLGIITPGKIGNSVVRHKSARQLREVFSQIIPELTQPIMLVVKLHTQVKYSDIPLYLHPRLYDSLRKMHVIARE